MIFNATFKNISAILWRSVLSVENTGVHGENQYTKTKLNTCSNNKKRETKINNNQRVFPQKTVVEQIRAMTTRR
jgi:hypothetical protein